MIAVIMLFMAAIYTWKKHIIKRESKSMNMKQVLELSLDNARDYARDGRITWKQYEHLNFLHNWSAYRFTGNATMLQHNYALKYGFDALENRHKRTKNIIQSIVND